MRAAAGGSSASRHVSSASQRDKLLMAFVLDQINIDLMLHKFTQFTDCVIYIDQPIVAIGYVTFQLDQNVMMDLG